MKYFDQEYVLRFFKIPNILLSVYIKQEWSLFLLYENMSFHRNTESCGDLFIHQLMNFSLEKKGLIPETQRANCKDFHQWL